MPLVKQVLARVVVDDLDAALPTYRALAGAEVEPTRFDFRDVRLAWVGPFLLLQVPPDRRADYERVATLLVDDLGPVADAVTAHRGEILEGPSPAPNGARMIARHGDGSVFEYIAAGG